MVMYLTEACKIESIDKPGTMPRMGTIIHGGNKRIVCFDLLDNINAGDYVIVHKGFAVSKIDADAAKENLNNILELIEKP